jgi:type I restriction enzyme S subunit
MSLPPYPKYKPSGVEWLGEVPEHWEVERSDTRVTSMKRQVTPEVFSGLEVMHYSIPVVQDLGTGTVENGEDIASAKQLIDGPVVLVSRLNPRKATICRASQHESLLTLASTEFVALKPTTGDIRFLEYLVLSELFRQRLDSWVQSVTRSHQRARPEEIYRFWNAWPDSDEQRDIADFLDRETAKIDTLVEKKRTLIKRLKEKRTALISRTVTRGLPPDAARAANLDPHPKLKPSGIDWLGDVPAHWTPKRLRFISPHITVGIVVEPSKYYEEEGVPCLRSLNVRPNALLDRDLVYISAESHRFLAKSMVRKGDLVAVRSGQPGTTAVVDDRFDGSNCIDLIIIRQPRSGEPSYFSYFLNSLPAQAQFTGGSGGAIQQHFNIATASDLWLVEPPAEEQLAIADFLDLETAKIDGMVVKVETAVERLQEYRTALITAAVTGKFDVRGVPAT